MAGAAEKHGLPHLDAMPVEFPTSPGAKFVVREKVVE
jgi:hypothetical protein